MTPDDTPDLAALGRLRNIVANARGGHPEQTSGLVSYHVGCDDYHKARNALGDDDTLDTILALLAKAGEAERLREALEAVADACQPGGESFPTGEAIVRSWNIAIRALAQPAPGVSSDD